MTSSMGTPCLLCGKLCGQRFPWEKATARCSVIAGEKVDINHEKRYNHPIMTVAERLRVSRGYRKLSQG